MNLSQLVAQEAQRLTHAGVCFGQGTLNAHDEAAWLVLWSLGLPLDTDLAQSEPLDDQAIARAQACIQRRIDSRQPAAYLTREAWLQGVPFYVDERAIVPRSLIAEVLADGTLDAWLSDQTYRVLDLCTGNGSLAVLSALAWPEVSVVASDLSHDALEVARINIERHRLEGRIHLHQGNGFEGLADPFDLIVCNPPYVCEARMDQLPAEFRAEPEMALSGGNDGMDFVRRLLRDAPALMNPQAVLVVEIGNEYAHFVSAFPDLEVVWLDTSAGEDQVFLVTRPALLALS